MYGDYLNEATELHKVQQNLLRKCTTWFGPLFSSLGPGKIGNHNVSTTTSSISLSWTAPPGEVFMYRVEWNNGGAVMSTYTNDPSAVLSDLIPGTIYTIRIIAVSGDNQTEGEGQTLTSVTSNEILLDFKFQLFVM